MTEDLPEDLAGRLDEIVDGELSEGLLEMVAGPRERQPAMEMPLAARQ